MLTTALVALIISSTPPASPAAGTYAKLSSGLSMYFEKHGTHGRPLLLLHGGGSTIEDSWSRVLPALEKTHVVIAPEQQGHGHTADLDRPLSYEQMATDTAELLQQLKLDGVDVIGWSDGGNVALLLALQHPKLVHRVMVSGANWRTDGLDPEVLKWMSTAKAADSSKEDIAVWAKGNPDPAHWPVFFGKAIKLWTQMARPLKELESIKTPVLVMAGDHDAVRLEHTLELHRFIQGSELAILPGTNHATQYIRPEWFVSIAEAFLAEPMPEEKK